MTASRELGSFLPLSTGLENPVKESRVESTLLLTSVIDHMALGPLFPACFSLEQGLITTEGRTEHTFLVEPSRDFIFLLS